MYRPVAKGRATDVNANRFLDSFLLTLVVAQLACFDVSERGVGGRGRSRANSQAVSCPNQRTTPRSCVRPLRVLQDMFASGFFASFLLHWCVTPLACFVVSECVGVWWTGLWVGVWGGASLPTAAGSSATGFFEKRKRKSVRSFKEAKRAFLRCSQPTHPTAVPLSLLSYF